MVEQYPTGLIQIMKIGDASKKPYINFGTQISGSQVKAARIPNLTPLTLFRGGVSFCHRINVKTAHFTR